MLDNVQRAIQAAAVAQLGIEMAKVHPLIVTMAKYMDGRWKEFDLIKGPLRDTSDERFTLNYDDCVHRAKRNMEAAGVAKRDLPEGVEKEEVVMAQLLDAANYIMLAIDVYAREDDNG